MTAMIRRLDDLGKRVRARRRSLGMTQVECAALCGLGPRFVRDVEHGKSTSQVGLVLQLLDGLGLRIELHGD